MSENNLIEPSTTTSDVLPVVGRSVVFNEDCMAVMKRYSDEFFHLAIVDPPYGAGDLIFTNMTQPKERKKRDYLKYDGGEWNEKPTIEYWNELFRVSQNQIVWGGNYFADVLPISRGWIFWNKLFDKTFNFSAGELAWTSFDCILRMVTMSSKAETRGGKDRTHPTQKPVGLYRWLLKNYSHYGDRILDTHVGSGSSRIACQKAGLEFVGCEIDTKYFDEQEARWKNFNSQGVLELE